MISVGLPLAGTPRRALRGPVRTLDERFRSSSGVVGDEGAFGECVDEPVTPVPGGEGEDSRRRGSRPRRGTAAGVYERELAFQMLNTLSDAAGLPEPGALVLRSGRIRRVPNSSLMNVSNSRLAKPLSRNGRQVQPTALDVDEDTARRDKTDREGTVLPTARPGADRRRVGHPRVDRSRRARALPDQPAQHIDRVTGEQIRRYERDHPGHQCSLASKIRVGHTRR